MKKILALIITILVIIGGVILIGMLLRGTSVDRIEKLIPETTLAYFSLSDISQAKEDIKDTRLWHALQEAELLPQLRKLWGEKVEEFAQETGVSIGQIIPFFSRAAAIAITSFDPSEAIPLGVVIAADAAGTKKALNKYLKDTLTPQLKEKGLLIGEVEHKGITYHYWASTSGKKVCYGFLKNIFLVSVTGEETFKAVINTHQGENDSLRKYRPFRRIKRLLGYKKGALGYLNFKLFLEQSSILSLLNAASKSELLKLSGITSLETIGYYSFVEEEGFKERFFLATEKHPQGLLKIMLRHPPRKMHSPAYVPRSIKNLSILTFEDPPELWEEIDEMLSTILAEENYNRFKERLSAAEKGLNFSLQEDFLECLGNELAVGTDIAPLLALSEKLTPQTIMARLPVILLIKVENQKRFTRTMDRALSLATLTLKAASKEEMCGDRSVKYMELELAGQKISPGFAFVEDFLIIGNDKSLVREAINAFDQGEGIDSAPDFSFVRKNLFRSATWFSYSNTKEIFKAVLSQLPAGSGEEEFDWQAGATKVADRLFGTGMVAVPTRQGIRMQAYSSIGHSASNVIMMAPLEKELLLKRFFFFPRPKPEPAGSTRE
ncbi:MAG: hypothetical protein OEX80_06050 [Candidatus Aminicenantes bacterium]|nr:hypothetical protein [Candidatus Aminicenantes bacterium]